LAIFREGRVTEVLEEHFDVIKVMVDLGDTMIEAVGYPRMLGPIGTGSSVVVNTTGVELDLGTGGLGFILWAEPNNLPNETAGHIMKMRYTPWQMNVSAAEAPESPDHERLKTVTSIQGLPVVVCGLHSQVAGVAAGVKAQRADARVGYLMTDGAALPLPLSDLVRSLKEVGLLDDTCTSGHAFGGDFESVNVFSGLAVLKHAANCDVAVVSMGPGVVGTETTLGHTALEQGQILDAATALDGLAIAALRIGFHDSRPRHEGISHHSMTALTLAARERAVVAVPLLTDVKMETIREQLRDSGIEGRHDVRMADGAPGVELLRDRGLDPSSMGRTMSSAPDLFLAASAAGRIAAESSG
jgi:hypothetical protein